MRNLKTLALPLVLISSVARAENPASRQIAQEMKRHIMQSEQESGQRRLRDLSHEFVEVSERLGQAMTEAQGMSLADSNSGLRRREIAVLDRRRAEIQDEMIRLEPSLARFRAPRPSPPTTWLPEEPVGVRRPSSVNARREAVRAALPPINMQELLRVRLEGSAARAKAITPLETIPL